jgi:hypothetical protein
LTPKGKAKSKSNAKPKAPGYIERRGRPKGSKNKKGKRSKFDGSDDDEFSYSELSSAEDAGDDVCTECGSGDNDEQMLLCDLCDKGYHIFCLDPPLKSIPKTDWYCPNCDSAEAQTDYASSSDVEAEGYTPSKSKKGRGPAKSAAEKAAMLKAEDGRKKGNGGKKSKPLDATGRDMHARGMSDSHALFNVYAKTAMQRGTSAAAQTKLHDELVVSQDLVDGELPLPPTSFDLPVRDPATMLRIAQCYEVLRRFGRVLYIKAFCIEDFARALSLYEHTPLLTTVHIALLRTLAAEIQVSDNFVDSLTWGLLDGHTWPELLRRFLLRYADEELESMVIEAADHLAEADYATMTLMHRLEVLEMLCSFVVGCNVIRNDLEGPPDFESDDFCKVCRVGGELVCCESCPVVFHLACMNPPLATLPEDAWYCSECDSNQTPGASNCELVEEEDEPGTKLYVLGRDRLQRTYYYVGRRIFVETYANEVAYYSTKEQLDVLVGVFEGTTDKYEKRLMRTVTQHYKQIVSHLEWTTEELKNQMQSTIAESPVDYPPIGKGYAIDEYDAAAEGSQDALTVWRKRNAKLLTPPTKANAAALVFVEEKAEDEDEDEDANAGAKVEELLANAMKDATEEWTSATDTLADGELERCSGTTTPMSTEPTKPESPPAPEEDEAGDDQLGANADPMSWGAKIDPSAYALSPGNNPPRIAPMEWQSALSPDTGREYYYHPKTKESVWKRPDTVMYMPTLNMTKGAKIYRLGDSLEGCREYMNMHEVGNVPPKLVTSKFFSSGQVLVSGLSGNERKMHASTIAVPGSDGEDYGGGLPRAYTPLAAARVYLLAFEQKFPSQLFFPNWTHARAKWATFVREASSAKELAIAMALMESAIKPWALCAAYTSEGATEFSASLLEQSADVVTDVNMRKPKPRKKQQTFFYDDDDDEEGGEKPRDVEVPVVEEPQATNRRFGNRNFFSPTPAKAQYQEFTWYKPKGLLTVGKQAAPVEEVDELELLEEVEEEVDAKPKGRGRSKGPVNKKTQRSSKRKAASALHDASDDEATANEGGGSKSEEEAMDAEEDPLPVAAPAVPASDGGGMQVDVATVSGVEDADMADANTASSMGMPVFACYSTTCSGIPLDGTCYSPACTRHRTDYWKLERASASKGHSTKLASIFAQCAKNSARLNLLKEAKRVRNQVMAKAQAAQKKESQALVAAKAYLLGRIPPPYTGRAVCPSTACRANAGICYIRTCPRRNGVKREVDEAALMQMEEDTAAQISTDVSDVGAATEATEEPASMDIIDEVADEEVVEGEGDGAEEVDEDAPFSVGVCPSAACRAGAGSCYLTTCSKRPEVESDDEESESEEEGDSTDCSRSKFCSRGKRHRGRCNAELKPESANGAATPTPKKSNKKQKEKKGSTGVKQANGKRTVLCKICKTAGHMAKTCKAPGAAEWREKNDESGAPRDPRSKRLSELASSAGFVAGNATPGGGRDALSPAGEGNRKSGRHTRSVDLYNVSDFGSRTQAKLLNFPITMDIEPDDEYSTEKLLLRLERDSGASDFLNLPTRQLRVAARKGGFAKIPGYVYKTNGTVPTLRTVWRKGVSDIQTMPKLMLAISTLDVSVKWDDIDTVKQRYNNRKGSEGHIQILTHRSSGWRTWIFATITSRVGDPQIEETRLEERSSWLKESDCHRLYELIGYFSSLDKLQRQKVLKDEKERYQIILAQQKLIKMKQQEVDRQHQAQLYAARVAVADEERRLKILADAEAGEVEKQRIRQECAEAAAQAKVSQATAAAWQAQAEANHASALQKQTAAAVVAAQQQQLANQQALLGGQFPQFLQAQMQQFGAMGGGGHPNPALFGGVQMGGMSYPTVMGGLPGSMQHPGGNGGQFGSPFGNTGADPAILAMLRQQADLREQILGTSGNDPNPVQWQKQNGGALVRKKNGFEQQKMTEFKKQRAHKKKTEIDRKKYEEANACKNALKDIVAHIVNAEKEAEQQKKAKIRDEREREKEARRQAKLHKKQYGPKGKALSNRKELLQCGMLQFLQHDLEAALEGRKTKKRKGIGGDDSRAKKDKREAYGFAQDEAEESEDESGKLFCICKQPSDDNRDWVGCEACQEWFHMECVGWNETNAGVYWCKRCTDMYHICEEDDMPRTIAKTLGIDPKQFVDLNKVRLKGLTQNSRLMAGTFLYVTGRDVEHEHKLLKQLLKVPTSKSKRGGDDSAAKPKKEKKEPQSRK